MDDGTAARFPLFQFSLQTGLPHPEVRDALAHLRQRRSDWQIAIWFATSNTWAGEWRPPIELLGSEPERLVKAAQQEAAEKVF